MRGASFRSAFQACYAASSQSRSALCCVVPRMKFTRRGILFVVSAPSGAGKTTLVEKLRQTLNLFYSVSCTTRAPRAGQIAGEDYQFLSETDFRERVEAGDFLEHVQVHGESYGTLRESAMMKLNDERNIMI